MVSTTSKDELVGETVSTYDRKSELKSFDETKVGVQGLIENGITKVPRIFHCVQSNLNDYSSNKSNPNLNVPTIDLTGIHNNDPILRNEVVRKVQYACENWGFFQVINHGIATHVMDEMIKGTCRFHQQDAKVRKEYYIRDRDPSRKVVYLSNYTLYHSPSADWRDTLSCSMAPRPPNPDQLPPVCSDIVIEYSEEVKALSSTLFELLSEALGLNSSHLKEMGCGEGLLLLCHYYPPCPEPELTIGTSKHSDACFMTVLLQDQIGGLQVLHQNQWIDVTPVHGALVVNIGDFLQLMSNDKFVSVQHRVLAKQIGPRISVASIFRPPVHSLKDMEKLIGPIKELLSEDSPPIYRETSMEEFVKRRFSDTIETSPLSPFKL